MPAEPHRFSRRLVCAASLCATSVRGIVGAQPTATSLADDVATYLSFGEHRAGLPSEELTASWIRLRLEALGYQTGLQKFPIQTLLRPGGRIEVGDLVAGLFPQWLPAAGSLGRPFVARLLPLEMEAAEPSIRIITKPVSLAGNWGETQDAWVAEAAAKGALAIVMAPDELTGEVYASNQHRLAPLTIPVGLLARRDLPNLVVAAREKNLLARLTLAGDLVDTHSINVVGRKAGRGPMLVVSTPLTGWFHCGGERGPGVAAMLRTAALLARTERPVLVLGTGSHEIGHTGMAHFLGQGGPKPAEVGFWFHFGASLATTKLDAKFGVTSPQFVVGTAASETRLRTALSPFVAGYANGSSRTPGEAGQVLGAGHLRFGGMIGTFPGFHTPADRGEAIDFMLLEKIVDASVALILSAAEAS